MKKYRILLSYFFRNNDIPLGYSCIQSLRELGHEAIDFDSTVESKIVNYFFKPINSIAKKLLGRGNLLDRHYNKIKIKYKQKQFINKINEFHPNIIVVIRAHDFIDSELIKMIKEKYNIERIIGWNVEGPLDFKNFIADSKYYDHYFCSHKYGYGNNDHIEYLPVYGTDLKLYKKIFTNYEPKFNVVFVGGYNQRRLFHIDIINNNSISIDIYGKWNSKYIKKLNHINFFPRGIWGEKLVCLYNKSKIVLNITGSDPLHYGSLNMRVFDVPCTGAFLLTDYCNELEEYFVIDKEIVCYNSPEEMVDKIKWYLKNDSIREKIAHNGYIKSFSLPTIKNRVEKLIAQ